LVEAFENLTSEKSEKEDWRYYSAGAIVIAIMIWRPSWIVPAAFVSALCVTFQSLKELSEEKASAPNEWFSIFAIGIFFFSIELLDWYFRYGNDVPFRDVLFPKDDTPADLRCIFMGWLFLFMSIFNWLKSLFFDDPKLGN